MAEFIFQQLHGDKMELRLSGWGAPFGRPRKKPVVTDAISVRENEVYYPGSNQPPTRHLFGTREEPWELEGRFMDAAGGAGYAQQMKRYCKEFVAAQQPCIITWEGVVQVRGIITDFEPGNESSAHVAWKMKIKVDEDALRSSRKVGFQPDPRKPKDMADHLAYLCVAVWEHTSEVPPSLSMSFLDSLDSLIGSVNSLAAAVASIADGIADFEQAMVGELRRLRAGLHQLQTAVLKLQNTYEQFQVDLAVQSSLASDGLLFWNGQASSGAAVLDILAEADAMDQQAKAAERGKVKGTYSARNGDTWEGIAVQMLGSAGRAGDIQRANGATGAPVPGTIYVIPR